MFGKVIIFTCLSIGWSHDNENGGIFSENWMDKMRYGKVNSETKSMEPKDLWETREFSLSETIGHPSQSLANKMERRIMKFLQHETSITTKGTNSLDGKCNTLFACINLPEPILKFLRSIGQKDINNLGSFTTRPSTEPYHLDATDNTILTSVKVSAYAIMFNDPFWWRQWYVQDYRTLNVPVMDLNVVPVYNMGFTGKGVTIGVVDTGILHDHPDLEGNFNVSLSYDVCLDKEGCSPPLVDNKVKETHGTNVAGVVGMVANNEKCGVGIAHEAKIAGIRATCREKQTPDKMAIALVHKLTYIDIYSNSWGPPDDPGKVCILNKLTEAAYKKGITEGRKGKGAIYTQCGGNGGDLGDHCATDCNINRAEVIAIGAANQFGKKSDFSERCTAIFTVTYSGSRFSGMVGAKEGVVTAKSDGGCRTSFSGTSAATPIASGIIALVLQANPDLTYRDVMHLIAMSSEVAPLSKNKKWYKNARGFYVHNSFGFGLMNAQNMVILARNRWKTVPVRNICSFKIIRDPPVEMRLDKKAIVEFKTDACASQWWRAIRYLEHVEVASTVKYGVRGDIMIDIISPSGTRSTLLERRKRDKSQEGLGGWSIMSVHNWGEDPRGMWTIEVYINPSTDNTDLVGHVHEFQIRFHGTFEMPNHYKTPRTYSWFKTPGRKSSSAKTKSKPS